MMIGALLLPKALFYDVVEPYTTECGLGIRKLVPDKRHVVYLELAEVFNVNPVVAELRLDALLPGADSDQLTL
jgi:hypothetical protein